MLRQQCVLLSADMGVGKTIICIEALRLLKYPSVLIICPAVAVANWQYELGRWGVPDGRARVVSYDKARTPKTRSSLRQFEFDVLILDEAHYLKTTDTKRTQAVYGDKGYVYQAKRIWAMSGTFMPNNASEIYPHLRVLFDHLLPAEAKGYDMFVDRYCAYTLESYRTPRGGRKYVKKIYGNRRKYLDELRSILQQASIRIRAEDVLPQLPPLSWAMLPLDSTELRRQLKELEASPEVRAYIQQLTEGGDLSQASFMTIRRLLAEAKTQPVQNWLAEFLESSAEKIVVFGHHVKPLNNLHDTFAEQSVLLTGDVPSAKRLSLVNKFQNDPACRIFFGQLIAASTAITLTAAKRVLFLEQSFVPAENAQAAARCHRIGQHSPVLAQVVMVPKSCDEQVTKLLLKKTMTLKELSYENEDKRSA